MKWSSISKRDFFLFKKLWVTIFFPNINNIAPPTLVIALLLPFAMIKNMFNYITKGGK